MKISRVANGNGNRNSTRKWNGIGIKNPFSQTSNINAAKLSSRMNCLHVRTVQKSMQDSLRLSQYTDYGILDLFLTNLGNLFRRIGDSCHLTCQNCTLEIAINVWSHMGPMVSLPRLGDIFSTYESRQT